MAASGAQLAQLVTGGSGNLQAGMASLATAPWARVDFSDDNKFSGASKSTGTAAKLGFAWRLHPSFAVGGVYQTKTHLGDLKTSGTGASMSAATGFSDSGQMTVRDFQWPSIMALGLAWQPHREWRIVADVKRIGWASVMKRFTMHYESAGAGGSVDFALPQNWRNQTVVSLGGEWKPSAALALRAGFNKGQQPIPQALVNPLFPATVKDHITLGLGYAFSPRTDFNASLVMAPTSSTDNGAGGSTRHKQSNVQLMVSHRL